MCDEKRLEKAERDIQGLQHLMVNLADSLKDFDKIRCELGCKCYKV